MTEHKMIPGNRISSYLIEERARYNYHVRMERTTILPSDPLHPVKTYWIQQYEPATFEKFLNMAHPTAKGVAALDWLAAANCTSYEIVHNPRITIEQERKAKG